MYKILISMRMILLSSLMICVLLGCGGGTTPPVIDLSPPAWDNQVGVINVVAGESTVTVHFGTATDLEGNGPVTYRLYYIDNTVTGSTDPFEGWSNSVVDNVTSPYTVDNLFNGHRYYFGIRCEDSLGNENKNTIVLSTIPFIDNRITLHTHVLEVDKSNLTFDGLEDSKATFSYTDTPPDVNIDDTLLSAIDGGFLFKVEDVQDTGSQLIINVAPGTFADAFEEMHLHAKLDFSGRDGSFIDDRQNQFEGEWHHVFEPLIHNFSGMSLYDGTAGRITISNGSIAFTPEIDFEIDYSVITGLNEFRFTTGGKLEFNCDVSATISAGINEAFELKVWQYTQPFAIGALGGTIVFEFFIGGTANGEIEGWVIAGFDATEQFSLGAEKHSSEWNSIAIRNPPVYNPHPINGGADGSLNLKAYVEPKISLMFYTVIGPSLNIQPYLQFDTDATLLPEPPCLTYDLYAGLSSDVAVEVDIFGKHEELISYTLFDEKLATLAEGDYPKDCSKTCNDNDGDGYGNPGRECCPGGPETDLNDEDPTIYPGAPEIYGDGVDQDCDGRDDNGNWCNLGGGEDMDWVCEDCLDCLCYCFTVPSEWPPGTTGHCEEEHFFPKRIPFKCFIDGVLICEEIPGGYQCVK